MLGSMRRYSETGNIQKYQELLVLVFSLGTSVLCKAVARTGTTAYGTRVNKDPISPGARFFAVAKSHLVGQLSRPRLERHSQRGFGFCGVRLRVVYFAALFMQSGLVMFLRYLGKDSSSRVIDGFEHPLFPPPGLARALRTGVFRGLVCFCFLSGCCSMRFHLRRQQARIRRQQLPQTKARNLLRFFWLCGFLAAMRMRGLQARLRYVI